MFMWRRTFCEGSDDDPFNIFIRQVAQLYPPTIDALPPVAPAAPPPLASTTTTTTMTVAHSETSIVPVVSPDFVGSCSISCAKRRYACRPLCSTGGGFVGSFFGGIFGGVFGSFCGSPPLHRERQAFLLPLMPQLWPPQPPQHKSSPEVGRFSFLRPPPFFLIKIDVRFSVRNRRRLLIPLRYITVVVDLRMLQTGRFAQIKFDLILLILNLQMFLSLIVERVVRIPQVADKCCSFFDVVFDDGTERFANCFRRL